MTVVTPACLKSATACAASGLAGSRIPTIPRKISSLSMGCETPVLMATASVRSPSADIAVTASCICLRRSGVSRKTPCTVLI